MCVILVSGSKCSEKREKKIGFLFLLAPLWNSCVWVFFAVVVVGAWKDLSLLSVVSYQLSAACFFFFFCLIFLLTLAFFGAMSAVVVIVIVATLLAVEIDACLAALCWTFGKGATVLEISPPSFFIFRIPLAMDARMHTVCMRKEGFRNWWFEMWDVGAGLDQHFATTSFVVFKVKSMLTILFIYPLPPPHQLLVSREPARSRVKYTYGTFEVQGRIQD